MHEWALAEAVFAALTKIQREEKVKKFSEIKLKIGELQNIDIETFYFAFKELSKNTPLDGAKIVIKKEEAIFKCRQCGKEWKLGLVKNRLGCSESEAIHFVPEIAHAFIRCPACNSPDFEVVRGRGIWIEQAKVSRQNTWTRGSPS
ncbi:MAG: hypothetical protein APU95_04620 [Hadesarchaea archaeon YNP_N21]|jgi:hydrogenase nickel incorporation protein HypA/HybF|nr:MAG: hypothetical protein APU95_04620 [Hadesarchaea archaeon YNP_N21]